jgi:GT2 family glycosyltransferase
VTRVGHEAPCPPAPPGPQGSVVVASYNARSTIRACLRSLAEQVGCPAYEVIVVDSSTDGTAEIVRREFPHVSLYAFATRKFPGDARNVGIARARADILAFTDTDCVADPHWIREIVEAHRAEAPAIGGVVDNGNPSELVGWASYFCEFSQWMPRAANTGSTTMVEIPTCCLSLKRWVFERYGPFLEGTYCSDTAFHWKLGRHGYRPLFVPRMRVSHLNISRLGAYFRKQRFHGTSFARVRVAEQRFSTGRRAAYLLISPVLPFLLFSRVVGRALRNRVYLRQLLRASPLVFAGLAAWSAGELIGYWSGSPEDHRQPRSEPVLSPRSLDRSSSSSAGRSSGAAAPARR